MVERTSNLTHLMINVFLRRAMHNAFNYWSSVSPLEFSETSASSADIMIKFAYSEHGDGNPFDYEGKKH